MKKNYHFIFMCIFVGIFGFFYLIDTSGDQSETKIIGDFTSVFENNYVSNKSENRKKFVVFITGAVETPDAFVVEDGSRILDVLDLAGGATDDADLEKVNLAAYLHDADYIYIPQKGETYEIIVDNVDNYSYNSFEYNSNIVNINTASKEELETLHGIGACISENIIEYRENFGGFASIDELKNVDKIGERLYNKIKDNVTI